MIQDKIIFLCENGSLYPFIFLYEILDIQLILALLYYT